jgi:hypothetical protein
MKQLQGLQNALQKAANLVVRAVRLLMVPM